MEEAPYYQAIPTNGARDIFERYGIDVHLENYSWVPQALGQAFVAVLLIGFVILVLRMLVEYLRVNDEELTREERLLNERQAEHAEDPHHRKLAVAE